jgi:hypothetical protein
MEGEQKWSTNNNAHNLSLAWLPVGVHTLPSTHQHFIALLTVSRGGHKDKSPCLLPEEEPHLLSFQENCNKLY